jgi:acetyltransferase-like isoleucine patch superfamily enzyme
VSFTIEPNCQIHPTATINVQHGFIGSGTIISANVTIEGTLVEIGREAFLDKGAIIGGGSCYDSSAYLKAGNWLHMGINSQINIARGVKIGDEFGCGIETKIFTHGAYLDSFNLGAPVQWGMVEIGNNVWMPNAWVNPGLKIGNNVVIAARSLVNQSIPSGVLAGGVPVKILKENYLPKILTFKEKIALADQYISQIKSRSGDVSFVFDLHYVPDEEIMHLTSDVGETKFYLKKKIIKGSLNAASIIVKDQLRRNGIRFPFSKMNNEWVPWE